VGPDEACDECSVIGVDPLRDGLVADFEMGSLIVEPSGDERGRPAFPDPGGDPAAETRVFESSAGPAWAVTVIRAALRFVSEVVSAPNGRDVSRKLAGDGRRAPAQLLGDRSERSALAPKPSEEITCMDGQVLVGMLVHPRILTRRLRNRSSVALRY